MGKGIGQACLAFFLSAAIWISIKTQNAINAIARTAAIVRIFGIKMISNKNPTRTASGKKKESKREKKDLYNDETRAKSTNRDTMKINPIIDQSMPDSMNPVNSEFIGKNGMKAGRVYFFDVFDDAIMPIAEATNTDTTKIIKKPGRMALKTTYMKIAPSRKKAPNTIKAKRESALNQAAINLHISVNIPDSRKAVNGRS